MEGALQVISEVHYDVIRGRYSKSGESESNKSRAACGSSLDLNARDKGCAKITRGSGCMHRNPKSESRNARISFKDTKAYNLKRSQIDAEYFLLARKLGKR